MEALGYATNRRPFTRLARLITYRALQHLRAEPPRTRAAGVEAALLWAAGLLDQAAPEARKRQLIRMVRGMYWLPRRRPIEWKLFRVWPANRPIRRISGIAAVLGRTMDSGLKHQPRNRASGRRRRWSDGRPCGAAVHWRRQGRRDHRERGAGRISTHVE